MSEFAVEVKTKIRQSTYKQLAVLAETNHTTVADLVAELVRRGTTPKRPVKKHLTPEQIDRVKEFASLHYSDAEVAMRLKVSRSTVQRYRKELGLQKSKEELHTIARQRAAMAVDNAATVAETRTN